MVIRADTNTQPAVSTASISLTYSLLTTSTPVFTDKRLQDHLSLSRLFQDLVHSPYPICIPPDPVKMSTRNSRGLRIITCANNRLVKDQAIRHSPSNPVFTRESYQCGDTDVLPTFPRSKPFPVSRSLRKTTVEEVLVIAALPQALISDLNLPDKTHEVPVSSSQPVVRPISFGPVSRLYIRRSWPLINPLWNPTVEPQCLTRSELKAYRQDLIRDDILAAIVIERKLTMPQCGRMEFVVNHILETNPEFKKADTARSLARLMDYCVKSFFIDFNWVAAGRALRTFVSSKQFPNSVS